MSNKPKNILFRADSSSTIGTGHIMRDLVLAEQFKDAHIIFAAQDLPGNINHKIEEKNYAIEILNSNDIEELDALIKELSIDMVVIDHYGIDHNFEKQLKANNPKLKIMSLDDTYEKHHCDILLNHNISANKKKYKDLVPNGCKLKCGSNYTLLRKEFYKEKKKYYKKRKKEKTIFLAMGGADTANLNIKILEVLKEFHGIKVNVVTTKANKNLEDLKGYTQNKKWIKLHIDSNKIAKLMKKSDFAIVTPSVTVNEVYFMELPFIAIKTADNQEDIYEYLNKKNNQVLNKFNRIFLKEEIIQIQQEK